MAKEFSEVGQTAALPPETLLAHITVIPKNGKDPSECGRYRPISLLNVDLKLFMKVLASHLQSLLPQLVDLDQVGFIPSCEARDNTIQVFNLVHHANKTNTPCVFLSTAAVKAFNWCFLFEVLMYMWVWRSSVNTTPHASVRVKGVFSKPLKISNGTCQGCPLFTFCPFDRAFY